MLFIPDYVATQLCCALQIKLTCVFTIIQPNLFQDPFARQVHQILLLFASNDRVLLAVHVFSSESRLNMSYTCLLCVASL